MSFLLRLALPDRPGALGAVATALGTVGADIVSLDVVERSADRAVDDLVIELPNGGLADSLVTAAKSVDGVQVELIRPYAAALDTYRELELLDAIVEAPRQGLALLTEGVVRIFRAGWSMVLVPSADNGSASVVAASAAAPELTELDLGWPINKAAALVPLPDWAPSSWHTVGTELACSPLGTERALLVGRAAMHWLPAEIARLSHLCGIVATVL